MDEKLMLSTGTLNKAFEKQLGKRLDAPDPTPEKAGTYLAAMTTKSAAAAADLGGFFDAWAKYYPTIVSALGWLDFIVPGKVLKIIKALLAVVNDPIIPILKEYLKKA